MVIYEPKGKAREYSPYACNIYNGCNHGCKYCYAAGMRYKKREDYLIPIARKNIISNFENDCNKLNNFNSQVLFCFMTDPYNMKEKEQMLTRRCLEIALHYKIPIAILTKSVLVLRDIDIFKKFGKNIKVGCTITFDNDKDSKEWEPGASLPFERFEVLKILKLNNIATWASFEPVIIPEQSLKMMQIAMQYIDIYKIGKLNNYKGLDKKINWNEFLQSSVNSLRKNNKLFYVKNDLRLAAPEIELFGNEKLQDRFNLNGWQTT